MTQRLVIYLLYIPVIQVSFFSMKLWTIFTMFLEKIRRARRKNFTSSLILGSFNRLRSWKLEINFALYVQGYQCLKAKWPWESCMRLSLDFSPFTSDLTLVLMSLSYFSSQWSAKTSRGETKENNWCKESFASSTDCVHCLGQFCLWSSFGWIIWWLDQSGLPISELFSAFHFPSTCNTFHMKHFA